MSTIETWKKLQDEDYFDNHRLYKDFKTEIPEYVAESDIKGKKVVEIGCGYGCHSVFLAKHAEMLYAIDVSRKIIERAYNFTKSFNLYNIRFLQADSYDTLIPYGIDYAFEYLVFQHIEPELTKKYIDNLYEKMNIGGMFNMQFRLGKKKGYYPAGKEPTVYYDRDEVIRYFDGCRIETVENRRRGNARWLFIVARKVR